MRAWRFGCLLNYHNALPFRREKSARSVKDRGLPVSGRRQFWAAGVVLGGIAAWALRTEVEPGALALVLGAGVLLGGLIGELVQALAALGAATSPGVPECALPADGRVEVVPIRGARGVANGCDPRFSAFAGLDDPEPGTRKPLPRRRSSPPLLGRVVMLSVFLGRDERSWTDREIGEAHAALLEAGRWIEREAARWNAPVNVAVGQTYFVVDDETPDEVELAFVSEGEGFGPLEARAVTKALVDTSRAAAVLGFPDTAEWMSQINARVEADVCVWFLHPRRAGRSLAIPLDQTELAGVSLAVCYARESSFPEPLAGRRPYSDPVTIVHEMLHLFGASDKYGVPLNRYPPRTVSSRDVMRLSESRLARLRIDLGTASELGWSVGDRPPELPPNDAATNAAVAKKKRPPRA